MGASSSRSRHAGRLTITTPPPLSTPLLTTTPTSPASPTTPTTPPTPIEARTVYDSSCNGKVCTDALAEDFLSITDILVSMITLASQVLSVTKTDKLGHIGQDAKDFSDTMIFIGTGYNLITTFFQLFLLYKERIKLFARHTENTTSASNVPAALYFRTESLVVDPIDYSRWRFLKPILFFAAILSIEAVLRWGVSDKKCNKLLAFTILSGISLLASLCYSSSLKAEKERLASLTDGEFCPTQAPSSLPLGGFCGYTGTLKTAGGILPSTWCHQKNPVTLTGIPKQSGNLEVYFPGSSLLAHIVCCACCVCCTACKEYPYAMWNFLRLMIPCSRNGAAQGLTVQPDSHSILNVRIN